MNGDVELWWTETGEGRPVVLVPGRGDNADQYPERFVGFSMGGLVLSDLVGRSPERLLSLTFLSAASLDPVAGIGPDFFDMVGDDPAATFVAAMHSPSDEDAAWMAEEIAVSERRVPRRPHARRARRRRSASSRSRTDRPTSTRFVTLRSW